MDNTTVFNVLSAPYSIIFHIAMFFTLNEYRFPRKKAALLTALLNAPVLALTIVMYLILGSEKGGQLAIFFYIIPQLFVSFYLSLYRDFRVISAYFFVSGIFVFIIQISNLIDYYSSLDDFIVMFVLRIVLFPAALILMIKFLSKPYRRLNAVIAKNQWIFACISVMYTLLLLIVFNFPTTLSKRPGDIPAFIIVFFMMILSNVYYMRTLLSQYDFFTEQQLNRNLEHEMEIMQKNIRHAEEENRNMAIYRHDLRHILNTLHRMIKEGSYLEAETFIEENISTIAGDETTVWCKNRILNAMFNAYFSDARDNRIKVSAEIDIKDISDEEATAFSLIISNAIENAIRAELKLPEEERIIRVRAIESPQLMFSVSNPYTGEVIFDENGLPVSKEEGHGIGISSMTAYCHKHNAAYDFKTEDGWFFVRVFKR